MYYLYIHFLGSLINLNLSIQSQGSHKWRSFWGRPALVTNQNQPVTRGFKQKTASKNTHRCEKHHTFPGQFAFMGSEIGLWISVLVLVSLFRRVLPQIGKNPSQSEAWEPLISTVRSWGLTTTAWVTSHLAFQDASQRPVSACVCVCWIKVQFLKGKHHGKQGAHRTWASGLNPKLRWLASSKKM